MSTLHKKKNQVTSSDPFDKIIFEGGLRINKVIADKKLNLLVVILNNAEVLNVPLSEFTRLTTAKQSDLDDYILLNKGIGIRWEKFDEDLSLKGLIKSSALHAMLNYLSPKKSKEQ